MVASVFIVPCIYSLIGAYPGILKLSAVHEGINECLLCCVSKTCPLSSLWDFQIHADPWRRIFQSYYIFPETSLLLGFCNAMIFTNIFLAFHTLIVNVLLLYSVYLTVKGEFFISAYHLKVCFVYSLLISLSLTVFLQAVSSFWDCLILVCWMEHLKFCMKCLVNSLPVQWH